MLCDDDDTLNCKNKCIMQPNSCIYLFSSPVAISQRDTYFQTTKCIRKCVAEWRHLVDVYYYYYYYYVLSLSSPRDIMNISHSRIRGMRAICVVNTDCLIIVKSVLIWFALLYCEGLELIPFSFNNGILAKTS